MIIKEGPNKRLRLDLWDMKPLNLIENTRTYDTVTSSPLFPPNFLFPVIQTCDTNVDEDICSCGDNAKFYSPVYLIMHILMLLLSYDLLIDMVIFHL